MMHDYDQLEDLLFDENNSVGSNKEFVYNLTNPDQVICEWFTLQQEMEEEQKAEEQKDTEEDNQEEEQMSSEKQEEELEDKDAKDQVQLIEDDKKIVQKNVLKKYDELVDIINKMNDCNWVEFTPQKNCPSIFSINLIYLLVKLMTPICFWFMVCSQYFRKQNYSYPNEQEMYQQLIQKLKLDHQEVTYRIDLEQLPKNINQESTLDSQLDYSLIDYIKSLYSISDQFSKQNYDKSVTIKQEFDYEDLLFISEIKHRIHQCSQNETMDLDTLIQVLTIELDYLTSQRQINLSQLKSKIDFKSTSFFNSLSNDPGDILIDLQGLTLDEKAYLSYLENRQQSGENLKELIKNSKKKVNLSGTARYLSNSKLDDMVCQICNDGDYLEDNLIVFCSRCNISVHQKCYGISIIPQDDWICELCQYYGPAGKNVRCPLCTKKGGAMKQTEILMKHSIFEQINPTFHQYATSHHIDKQELYNDEDVVSYSSEKEPYQEKLYYDFQLIQNNEINNSDEPKSQYIWVHLSCAYWLPECFFHNDKQSGSKIMGLQNIDKKRFNLQCHICKMKKQGACIQCSKGKCCTAFHAECARRAQFFMEPRPYPQSYLINCEKHMPLKLKRILENRAKGFVEEIQVFCKSIEKLLQQKQNASNVNNNMISSEKKKRLALKAEQQEIEAEIKEENKKIMSQLQKFIDESNINKLVIELNKVKNGYQVEKIQQPQPQLNDINQISRSDEIWDKFKYEDYNSDQVYRLYKRAIRMDKKTRNIKQKKVSDMYEEEVNARRRMKVIRKWKTKQKQNQIANQVVINNQQQQQQEQQQALGILKIKIAKSELLEKQVLYCICKKPFNEECDKCQEWYHLKCIGFNKSVEKAEEINFICIKCQQTINREDLKKLRIQYKEYFLDPTFKNVKKDEFEHLQQQSTQDQLQKQKIYFTRKNSKLNYRNMNKEVNKNSNSKQQQQKSVNQQQENNQKQTGKQQINQVETYLKLEQKDNKIFITPQNQNNKNHSQCKITTRQKIRHYK